MEQNLTGSSSATCQDLIGNLPTNVSSSSRKEGVISNRELAQRARREREKLGQQPKQSEIEISPCVGPSSVQIRPTNLFVGSTGAQPEHNYVLEHPLV